MIIAHYQNRIKILNFPDYLTTYDVQPKDNLNTDRGRANKPLSNPTEENVIFL